MMGMRQVALLLSVLIAAPPAWAGPVVRSANVPAGQVGVQTVPVLNVSAPGIVVPGAALAAPSFDSALPSLPSLTPLTPSPAESAATSAPVLRPVAPRAANPASPEAPSAPKRTTLKLVSDALGGAAKAAQKLPGLAALGAKIAAPSPDSNAADARQASERFFNLKAGFGDQRELEEAIDAVEAADSAPLRPSDFFTEAAAGARGRGAVSKGREKSRPTPRYSARRVKFNGKTFPSVGFRPDRPLQDHLIEAIDAAETSVTLAVYEFKNRDVLNALRRARDRGVAVKVLVDFSNAFPFKREDSDYWPQRSLELQSLTMERGFEVKVVRGLWRYGIMHNKVGVFDGKFGFFGSYNLTRYAEHNHFENINFVDDERRVGALAAVQAHLESVSVPFDEALTHPWTGEAPPPPAPPAPDIRFNGVDLPAWMFTPNPEAEDFVIRGIDAAKKSIDLSMFTYTSPKITKALVAAHERGVKVRVLLDESQTGRSYQKPYAEYLAFHGIPVKTLAGPNPDGPKYAEKNHNKFMVLDGKLVYTGSFNYTKSAAYTNYENIFLLDHKTDAKAYEAYYGDMFAMGRAARVVPPTAEPQLGDDDELVESLRGPPTPIPAPPVWDALPAARTIEFNGEKFPSALVRPQNPVSEILIKAIDSSKESIDLALYEFNLEPLMEAVRRAKARGVKVRVVIDYQHVFPKGTRSDGEDARRSANVEALIAEGYEIKVLRGVRAQGIMHQKIAIFDGKMINFGSYNWAKSAEQSHFESMMFDDEKPRVDFYKSMYEWLWDYAVEVDEAEEHPWSKERPAHGPIDEDMAIEHNGERFPRQAFSPEGLIEETILRAIRAADKTIDIAMFSFYSARIAEELLIAKNRGIAVRLVFDKMQSKLMKLDNWFAYYGFDVKMIAGPNPFGNVFWEKNHNKFMIVDNKLMEIGSYNYTKNAEVNSYENANFYYDSPEVAFFAAYFEMLHRTGWKPMTPKTPPDGFPTPEDFFNPERLEALLGDSAEF